MSRPRRVSPGEGVRPWFSLVLGGIGLLLSLGGERLGAQSTSPPPASTGVDSAPASLRHIQEVEPRSGPPGTQVRIYTENMPPQGKVLVGVGAIGVGFEVLSEGLQGQWGDVTASLRIPQSATHDRPVRIIFLNGLFSPVGLSDAFHVTDDRGLIRRTGRVQAGEAGCTLALEGTHGERYGLAGSLGGVEEGAWVGVEGQWEEDRCGAGGAIRVTRLVAPDPESPPPPASPPPGAR
jgi:hypothetical protein